MALAVAEAPLKLKDVRATLPEASRNLPLQAPLKLKDVVPAAELCSLMHRTYATFTQALEPPLLKAATALPPPPPRPGAAVASEGEPERTAGGG